MGLQTLPLHQFERSMPRLRKLSILACRPNVRRLSRPCPALRASYGDSRVPSTALRGKATRRETLSLPKDKSANFCFFVVMLRDEPFSASKK